MQKKLLIFGGIFVGLLLLFNQSRTLNSQTVVPPTVQQVISQPSVYLPTNTPTPTPTTALSNDNYYTNVDGNSIHAPAYSNTVPAGATAQCADGTYSFSQHRRGTCSHHGGVSEWL